MSVLQAPGSATHGARSVFDSGHFMPDEEGDGDVTTRPGRMQNLYLSWRFAWDERMRMNTFIVVFASLTDGRHLFQYLPLTLPLFWIDDTERELFCRSRPNPRGGPARSFLRIHHRAMMERVIRGGFGLQLLALTLRSGVYRVNKLRRTTAPTSTLYRAMPPGRSCSTPPPRECDTVRCLPIRLSGSRGPGATTRLCALQQPTCTWTGP